MHHGPQGPMSCSSWKSRTDSDIAEDLDHPTDHDGTIHLSPQCITICRLNKYIYIYIMYIYNVYIYNVYIYNIYNVYIYNVYI